MGLSHLISNIFNTKTTDTYVGLENSVESSDLTHLVVESDNFDIVVKQGDDSKVEYKLLINRGYTLSDMIFDVNCNTSQISFSIRTIKNNMSGTLELFIPRSLVDVFMKCINGDIVTSKIAISTMNLNTTNGDIDVITIDDDYNISCNSLNGDISNHKRAYSNASKTIVCSSENGDITIK